MAQKKLPKGDKSELIEAMFGEQGLDFPVKEVVTLLKKQGYDVSQPLVYEVRRKLQAETADEAPLTVDELQQMRSFVLKIGSLSRVKKLVEALEDVQDIPT